MTQTLEFRHPPTVPHMDFAELKPKTFDLWKELHLLNDCYVPEEDTFEREIQQYGDLSQETTWRKAYAALNAKFLADGCLEDGQYLIEFYLLYSSQKWGWRELLPDVIEELCLIPEAVEAIEYGLASIRQYGCEYGAESAEVEHLGELVNGTIAEKRGLKSEPTPISARNTG